jgi:hypothetical protein
MADAHWVKHNVKVRQSGTGTAVPGIITLSTPTSGYIGFQDYITENNSVVFYYLEYLTDWEFGYARIDTTNGNLVRDVSYMGVMGTSDPDWEHVVVPEGATCLLTCPAYPQFYDGCELWNTGWQDIPADTYTQVEFGPGEATYDPWDQVLSDDVNSHYGVLCCPWRPGSRAYAEVSFEDAPGGTYRGLYLNVVRYSPTRSVRQYYYTQTRPSTSTELVTLQLRSGVYQHEDMLQNWPSLYKWEIQVRHDNKVEGAPTSLGITDAKLFVEYFT